MLFNSLEYLIFLPLVFLCYWFVFRPRKIQNLFVLCASYVFYGWWNWHFLILIFITSLCSFVSGILIEKYRDRNLKPGTLNLKPGTLNLELSWWVSLANILINLGILGVYKYYNFFVESFCQLFSLNPQHSTLNLILPVGISFYTFQALGYSIDVYRGKTKATHDPVQFFAFLSFFPQLVAGPIESARNLLPQFAVDRHFDGKVAADGMRQILWGLFKKMVIADNCAPVVDTIFRDYAHYSGGILIIATVLFTFQIYGDFSGYSDIAIGSAKLFGIRLTRNFNIPFFSRDMGEFWRRWHISLMKWFTEYVYFPLGGSRCSKAKHIRNILIVFFVSGLWHGAGWNFITWGLFNGFLVVCCAFMGIKHTDTVAEGHLLPSMKDGAQILLVFILAVIGLTLFRSDTPTDFCCYIQSCCGNWTSAYTNPYRRTDTLYYITAYIIVLVVTEWLTRQRQHGLDLPERFLSKRLLPVRMVLYSLFFVFILLKAGVHGAFIYFQF